jgi:hypothetical protein
MSRLANIMMSLVFVLAAAVQLNDPDPTLWIIVYCLGASICAIQASVESSKLWLNVLWLSLAISAGSLGMYKGSWVDSIDFVSSGATYQAEALRECAGLSIIVLWSFINLCGDWIHAGAHTARNKTLLAAAVPCVIGLLWIAWQYATMYGYVDVVPHCRGSLESLVSAMGNSDL